MKVNIKKTKTPPEPVKASDVSPRKDRKWNVFSEKSDEKEIRGRA